MALSMTSEIRCEDVHIVKEFKEGKVWMLQSIDADQIVIKFEGIASEQLRDARKVVKVVDPGAGFKILTASEHWALKEYVRLFQELVEAYDGLGITNHPLQQTDRLAIENLRQALDWLPIGRSLLTIKTDCDLEGWVAGLPAMESIATYAQDTGALRVFCETYGFKGLAKSLEVQAANALGTAPALAGNGVRASSASLRGSDPISSNAACNSPSSMSISPRPALSATRPIRSASRVSASFSCS